MENKKVTPFINAITQVLEQFGLTDIQTASVEKKEEMIITSDVTAFVGLVGEMCGNAAYCFSQDTAKSLASLMMMGMPISEVDAMARSALAELSNMITGVAITAFADEEEIDLEVTPPTLVSGEDMIFILTFLDTQAIILNTPIGKIEINIALEA